jgi:hypothetical protein
MESIRKIYFLHCGFYKAKCLVETIDPEYDLHSEFDKIKTQFNSVTTEEESINFDTYIDLDKQSSKPLNEFIQIQSVTQCESIRMPPKSHLHFFITIQTYAKISDRADNSLRS